jgi:Flp pilus assembly protein TadD
VHDDLVQIGFWQPLAIFSAFVLDGDDLSRMLAGVEELHTDDRPVVEYLAPRATYDDTATVNDVGIQALQTKTFPRIANFDETRDLDARAKYLLGFGMASIGRIDPAIRLMEQSVAGEVTDPKFLVGLGNQYRARGMNIKAMAAYARALALAPGDDEAARNLADLQRGQGDEAGAEATLRGALQRVPDNAALAIAVGKLLLESGRGASAEALLAPALAKEPQNAALLVVAGRAMAAAGHADRAKDVLRQAAALAPEDAQTQREVAAAMLELGDADGAATAYARACELEPGSVEAHAGLAQASFRRGDAAGAREARRRALELDPYNSAMLALPAN